MERIQYIRELRERLRVEDDPEVEMELLMLYLEALRAVLDWIE